MIHIGELACLSVGNIMKKFIKYSILILLLLIIFLFIIERIAHHHALLNNARILSSIIYVKEIDYKKERGCYTSDLILFERDILSHNWGYNYGIISDNNIYFTRDYFFKITKKANSLEDIKKCHLYNRSWYKCPEMLYHAGIIRCMKKLKSVVSCDHFLIFAVTPYWNKYIALSVDETKEITRHECP